MVAKSPIEVLTVEKTVVCLCSMNSKENVFLPPCFLLLGGDHGETKLVNLL